MKSLKSGSARFALFLFLGSILAPPLRADSVRFCLDPDVWCRKSLLFPRPDLENPRFRIPDDPGPAPSFHGNRAGLTKKTLLFTAGYLAAIPVAGHFLWWESEEKVAFNFQSEGWFGRDTYAGGADKASHIVIGYLGFQVLNAGYRSIGHTESSSRWLAMAGVAVGGLVVEIGDGLTVYGYSWEDVTANVIGAAAGAAISSAKLDDTLGFRLGWVPKTIPPPCCRATAYGSDYSDDIHTLDVKLGGLFPRIGLKPGIGKLFLFSLTYAGKGYRFSPVEVRKRNVGFELGLNLPEVLRAVGVKDEWWWAKPILTFLTYFRIPWSAFGWRYDLNSGRWHGPDTGEKFRPGLVIYD